MLLYALRIATKARCALCVARCALCAAALRAARCALRGPRCALRGGASRVARPCERPCERPNILGRSQGRSQGRCRRPNLQQQRAPAPRPRARLAARRAAARHARRAPQAARRACAHHAPRASRARHLPTRKEPAPPTACLVRSSGASLTPRLAPTPALLQASAGLRAPPTRNAKGTRLRPAGAFQLEVPNSARRAPFFGGAAGPTSKFRVGVISTRSEYTLLYSERGGITPRRPAGGGAVGGI